MTENSRRVEGGTWEGRGGRGSIERGLGESLQDAPVYPGEGDRCRRVEPEARC